MTQKYFIDRYRNFKKQFFLNQGDIYKEKYAFIGAGSHSMTNLYPCIQYLNIPLKYVCTKNISNAKKMALRFQGCTGTDRITDVLEDSSVKGVFVCLPPQLHFETVKVLFNYSKHVLVEKPICYSSAELKVLISLQKENICVYGLQKNFCQVNKVLKKHISDTLSYQYKYVTGAYPEGDPIFELFIHPVNNVIDLFGDAYIKYIYKKVSNKTITIFLLLEHHTGVAGSIELSTNYSWNDPVDYLEINNKHQILKADYPNKLTQTDKPKSILNLPLEKLFIKSSIHKSYLNNTGFLPVAENNSLVIQGFYDEIKYFVNSVEKNEKYYGDKLSKLLSTYDILEAISLTQV